MLYAAEHTRLARLFEDCRERLLDLSRRNPMLNYKHRPRSKRQLQIVDEVLEEVYGLLARETTALDLIALPEPEDIPAEERTDEFRSALDHAKVSDLEYLTKLSVLEGAARADEFEIGKLDRWLRDRVREALGLPSRPDAKGVDVAAHARSLGIDPSIELPVTNSRLTHRDKKLQTLLFVEDLEARLERIAEEARSAEQEMGLSTLFLAFGFLEWYEADQSDKANFAPLLLLPVRLERRVVNGRKVFSLTSGAEAAEANLSLRKLLEQRFDRHLPDFGADEDTNDSVEGYLSRVREVVSGLKRWNVRRFLTLGHFAFGRLAMYADLDPGNWEGHPASHPLVSAVLRGSDVREGDDPTAVPPDYDIDDPEIEKSAPFLIHDADASQHSAIIDVMKGGNLVIEGPPGTGKSQTITNVIANALGQGKTVLFLAEKLAALQVVKRRLDTAGLGEFCLELHSEKVSPRLVVSSLKQRAELSPQIGPAHPRPDYATWDAARKELHDYVVALHAIEEDGQTPFSLIWRAVAGRSDGVDLLSAFKPAAVPVRLVSTPTEAARVKSEIKIYADVAQAFAEAFQDPWLSPWSKVGLGKAPRYASREILDVLTAAGKASEDLAAIANRFGGLGVRTASDLQRVSSSVTALPDAPEGVPISRLAALDSKQVEEAIQALRTMVRCHRELQDHEHVATLSAEQLARAADLLASARACGLADLPPREAYRVAEDRIFSAEQLSGLFEALEPALVILGLDRQIEVETLDAAAVAVLAAAAIPEDLRRYMAWTPSERGAQLEEVLEAWKALTKAENAWRERAPGYNPASRPKPVALTAAAATLRKRSLGRMVSKLSGSLGTAQETLELLQLPADDTAPEAVDALAKHISKVEEFESSLKNRHLAGEFWDGLRTPFDTLFKSAQAREIVTEKLQLLHGGKETAEALLQLRDDRISELGAYADAAKRYRARPRDGVAVEGETVAEALGRLRHTVALARSLLGRDPDRAFAPIQAQVELLPTLADSERLRRKLFDTLSRNTVAQQIAGIAQSEAQFDEIERAIQWLRAVQSLSIPTTAREALASDAASQARQELINCAEAARGPLTALDHATMQLAQDFKITRVIDDDLEETSRRIHDLVRHGAELPDYIDLKDHREKLEHAGLTEFLACAEGQNIPSLQLENLFDCLLVRRRAEGSIRNHPPLSRGSGVTLEARRKAFAEQDKKKISDDQRAIRAKLFQARPDWGSNYGPRRNWTGMHLLYNEFQKERRFTPVRQLVVRAGSAIRALKPCFMMSPLSLAKYVPSSGMTFDVLVIDEASQMKPEDALGGMLRAKQVVVVGDPKQLPPTDFFNRSADAPSPDEEDFEDIDDESILELCQKTFKAKRRLKWHYRSRCESLIAFSNREFYGNGLITFPMARPGSFSIDLVQVRGSYEAGRNPLEAQHVAEEALAFMRHFADHPAESMPTLGIVAVNTDQRDLIFEGLRRLEAGDERVERYREKATQRGEPVFVKNLENVQGDERDFILVSLTYGCMPGHSAVMQRFGPIAGKQGHRRLNVLFSRARIRLGLFTSFTSADVRPSETSSQGIHVLKRYLEYAETRGRATAEILGREVDSDFEAEVAGRLEERGYLVDAQVGVSGFRIDLGVRHPDRPETYLAGIECDGAAYHSSKSARDRDRLREEVLRSLGWDIVRVWSTDWFEDSDRQTEKLVRKLEALRERPSSSPSDYRLLGSETSCRPPRAHTDAEAPSAVHQCLLALET